MLPFDPIGALIVRGLGDIATRAGIDIARARIATTAIEGFTVDSLIINLACQQPFGLKEVLR
jgi:hypothetical protein